MDIACLVLFALQQADELILVNQVSVTKCLTDLLKRAIKKSLVCLPAQIDRMQGISDIFETSLAQQAAKGCAWCDRLWFCRKPIKGVVIRLVVKYVYILPGKIDKSLVSVAGPGSWHDIDHINRATSFQQMLALFQERAPTLGRPENERRVDMNEVEFLFLFEFKLLKIVKLELHVVRMVCSLLYCCNILRIVV